VYHILWWPPVKQVGYPAALPRIRRLVKRISPDVLHSHYAISYGVLGALTGFRPHVIGAWGSDILITPGASKLRWAVLVRALRRADLITSLSGQITRVLIERGVPGEKIETIPFGVDTQLFVLVGIRTVTQTSTSFVPEDSITFTMWLFCSGRCPK